MSQSVYGLNAHLKYIKNWSQFTAFAHAMNSQTIVAVIDELRPDVKQKVYDLRDALVDTQTRIIVRIVHPEDGGFFKPRADGFNYIASPTDFLNEYGEFGRGGFSLYTLNEPNGYAGIDHISRLISWVKAVITQANHRDISLTVCNWGVGHPNVAGEQWDSRFDEVLKLLSGNHLHRLGLHEYNPKGQGGRIGRLNAVVKRCDALGIVPPDMVITEYGFDSDGGAQNGYKSRSITASEYASTMLRDFETVYKTLAEKELLTGVNIFCYGNSGGWENFDIEDDGELKGALLALRSQERITVGKRKTATLPTPIPVPVPDPYAAILELIALQRESLKMLSAVVDSIQAYVAKQTAAIEKVSESLPKAA
jgi:hypothetical protein